MNQSDKDLWDIDAVKGWCIIEDINAMFKRKMDELKQHVIYEKAEMV